MSALSLAKKQIQEPKKSYCFIEFDKINPDILPCALKEESSILE